MCRAQVVGISTLSFLGSALLLKAKKAVFLPALLPTHADMLHAAMQEGVGCRISAATDPCQPRSQSTRPEKK